MKDENGIRYYRQDGGEAWLIGTAVAVALLGVGYLVFNANGADPKVTEKQAACMIANPGMDCEQVTRWEPITPASGEQKHG